MEMAERVGQLICQIDQISSRKGLRAAQRRALLKCRRLLSRLSRSLDKGSSREDRIRVSADEVFRVVNEVCKLLTTYFRREV